MLEPRDYQTNALNELLSYFKFYTGNPLLEAPTASGKSLIQAMFIRHALENFKNQKILSLTHTKELVEQNYLELLENYPGVSAGIYSASLKKRQHKHKIIFAGIQSVYKKAQLFGKINIMFIDEAHLCPVKISTGMYRSFINDLLDINPKMKIIGLTATPFRLDNGYLTHGENRIFTHLIDAESYGAGVDRLIRKGWVSNLITTRHNIEYDTSGVGISGGEFKKQELNNCINEQQETTALACLDIINQAQLQRRKSWIIFAQNVEHGEYINNFMLDHCVDSALITGETDSDERKTLIDLCKAQELTCLVNVNVLTTGFNAKCIDLIGDLKPTESTSLYVQIAGRGMRISPETNKENCLYLCYSGNIEKHGPINEIKKPKNKTAGEGEGVGPLKECANETCLRLIPTPCLTCPYCGYEYPKPEVSDIVVDIKSSEEDIIAFAEPVEEGITKWMFSVHKKIGKPDSIKIDYFAGFGGSIISEYLTIWHGGGATKRAKRWFYENVPDWCEKHEEYVFDVLQPGDAQKVADVLLKNAELPAALIIQKNGKFKEIAGRVA